MAKMSLSSQRTSTTILSIAIVSLTLYHIASAMDNYNNYGGVVTEDFMGLNPRSGSRFLAGNPKNCDPQNGNICSATPVKDSTTELLQCCTNQCRNVLSDKNNCGACGNKCWFGQLCCNGHCTVVAYDVSNCGGCDTVCSPGVRCEYGSCGYA